MEISRYYYKCFKQSFIFYKIYALKEEEKRLLNNKCLCYEKPLFDNFINYL